MSLMRHDSLVPLRQKNYKLFVTWSHLNFLPQCSLPSERSQIDASLYSKRKQCYIMWMSVSGSFAFLTCERKSSFSDLSVCEVCTSLAVANLGPVLLCPW